MTAAMGVARATDVIADDGGRGMLRFSARSLRQIAEGADGLAEISADLDYSM